MDGLGRARLASGSLPAAVPGKPHSHAMGREMAARRGLLIRHEIRQRLPVGHRLRMLPAISAFVDRERQAEHLLRLRPVAVTLEVLKTRGVPVAG